MSIKNETIDLHVWDTSGQERFRCITRNFYRDCTGIIIVFDLTNTQTFKNVQLWLDQINAEVDDSVTKILVGNKLDLNREVGIDDVQNLMEDYNLPYFETSAMTGGNIGHLFTFMATILHDKSMERTGASTIDFTRVESERISLTSSGQKSPKKNQKVKNDGCCS